jgi:hypothetical protein
MERMNTAGHLDFLRRANVHLENFFARFSGAPVLGTNEEVEALLRVERALHSVRALLDGGLKETSDHETQNELARYRANLLRLRRELAMMQDSAAGCQARLFVRQKHLHAAQAWCAASRATR